MWTWENVIVMIESLTGRSWGAFPVECSLAEGFFIRFLKVGRYCGSLLFGYFLEGVVYAGCVLDGFFRSVCDCRWKENVLGHLP